MKPPRHDLPPVLRRKLADKARRDLERAQEARRQSTAPLDERTAQAREALYGSRNGKRRKGR